MAATLVFAQRRFQRHVWLAAIAMALLLIGMVLALRTMSSDHDTQARLRHALAITDGAFEAQQAAAELQRHLALATPLPAIADDAGGAAGLLRESLRELRQRAQQLQTLGLSAREAEPVESVLQATHALDRLLESPQSNGAPAQPVTTAAKASGEAPAAATHTAATKASATATLPTLEWNARLQAAAAQLERVTHALGALVDLQGDSHQAQAVAAAIANSNLRLALIGVSGLAFALALVFALFAWRAAAASDRQLLELNEIANTDGLTGITNRRRLDDMLPIELARAERIGYSLTVAMLDIDHFKRFNDKRGHVAGDQLLRAAAQAWRKQMRPTDLLARYGGEEFTLVLPACSSEQAAQLIDRLRPLTPERQTFSAGVATWNGHDAPTLLLQLADVALLQAKRSGRNRTVISGLEPQGVLPLRSVTAA